MVELAQGTWVVVADGEKALFLRNLTDAEDPNLEVISQAGQENPSSREQGASAPGRMPDVGQGQRSAMQETDWHRLAKDRFAKDLAETLYARAHAGAFDRLVIVAGPRVLGALREALHPEVAQRVVAEVAQELTGHPVHEIEAHVVKALARA